ncbi:MAG: hypothetical protein DDG59_12980 [Anaerolineae bacterium]|jgi:hypothetical protein|nr:MAG: hypothetical protein DDG59_12980 [Anaerolineae bacterium]
MYQEWFVTEYFSQYDEFEDWAKGGKTRSINVYDKWMLIVNLNQQEEAQVTLTFYYMDEPPQEFTFRLAAGRQGRLHFSDEPDNLGTINLPPGCNPRKRFGVRVRSTQPVVVQATAGDRIGEERITNSMATYLYHPGPLGEAEKTWMYVDCVYLVSDRFPLEEREWLSVLNPNSQTAHCTVTFIPGGDVDVGLQVSKPIQASVAEVQHAFEVAPERLFSVLISDWQDVLPNQPYAVRVESDLPITLQGIRHIFERGQYEFSRCWAVLDAIPIPPAVRR